MTRTKRGLAVDGRLAVRWGPEVGRGVHGYWNFGARISNGERITDFGVGWGGRWLYGAAVETSVVEVAPSKRPRQ